MAKSGFLLIELMVAIFIGLVFISALMRMQSILLELQDSFFMRDKALLMATQWLEHEALPEQTMPVQVTSGIAMSGRNFEFDFEQPDKDKFGSRSSLHALKVKVKWRSLAGKNCCLDI